MNTILFFDDWALDRRINVERKISRPRLVSESPLPGARTYGSGNFVTVFYLSEQKRYRLYYTVAPPKMSDWKKHGGGIVCMESDDGIEWHGTSEIVGERMWSDNVPNVWMRDGIVQYDPEDTNESRRFKMMARLSFTGESKDMLGLMVYSQDGRQWMPDESAVWHRQNPDTANWLFPMKRAGRWAITTRAMFGDRRIALVESEDLKTWTQPRVVLTPDALDPPTAQLYGMPVFPYEDVFVGFLWLMTTDPAEMEVSKMLGRCDARLAYSYDGLAWQRMTHEPFMPCAEFAEYGGGSIYPSGMVITPDERIRIYSRASIIEHMRESENPPDILPEMLQVHELRRDGFVCLQSAGGYGELMTKPLRLDGPELSLNVLAPVGEVRVEVTDVNGKPLEGYGMDDCVPFRGDELFWKPQWQDHADLAQVLANGETIRLRIRLFHAQIYAIRVPCHVSYFPGYLAEHFG